MACEDWLPIATCSDVLNWLFSFFGFAGLFVLSF